MATNSKNNERYIYRIDQPKKHNHGWYLNRTILGHTYRKFFADAEYGGREKALKAARGERAFIEANLAAIERRLTRINLKDERVAAVEDKAASKMADEAAGKAARKIASKSRKAAKSTRKAAKPPAGVEGEDAALEASAAVAE